MNAQIDAQMDVHDAWSFAQLEDFWVCYEPLTPWGRDHHDRRWVCADIGRISQSHDDIELALAFLQRLEADPIALDRISFHLKRMPRLPLERKSEYELLELFQVKKFLANYRGLLSRLDPEVCRLFGLIARCTELAAELDRGGSDAETFFLADTYHPELGPLRRQLLELDAQLRAARCAREAQAKLQHGLLFDGRDFILVQRDKLPAATELAAHYLAEAYDDQTVMLRLLPDASQLSLAGRREQLLDSERQLEAAVLRHLSALVAAQMAELHSAVLAVTRWDLARAGALLAQRFAMVRPQLSAATPAALPQLKAGRFVPCELECRQLNLHYEALNLNLEASAAVLFGSNMGGKTVVLKTLLFFQLLAQAGLFVPAESFITRVFDHIEYIGELAGERLAGLSGFGFEIWRFQRVWGLHNALIAFDELARTTGSHDAEALLSAIIEAYADSPASRQTQLVPSLALFTTHFSAVARLPGVQYLRMQGLDQQAACLSEDAGSGKLLQHRLAAINQHMRYRIVAADDNSLGSSDALAIAAMLGLDCRLVERAGQFFESGSKPGGHKGSQPGQLAGTT